jgi:cell division protein FtsB
LRPRLRTNDKTLDALREIKSDRAAEIERKRQEAEKQQEFESLKKRITGINQQIARLGCAPS